MGDIMLHGVLNMPLPNDPKELGIIEWMQFRDRAREASVRINADAATISRLTAELQESRNYALALEQEMKARDEPTHAQIMADPRIKALVEALGAMVARHTLYCGGPDLPHAGHADVKIMGMANAALSALEPKP